MVFDKFLHRDIACLPRHPHQQAHNCADAQTERCPKCPGLACGILICWLAGWSSVHLAVKLNSVKGEISDLTLDVSDNFLHWCAFLVESIFWYAGFTLASLWAEILSYENFSSGYESLLEILWFRLICNGLGFIYLQTEYWVSSNYVDRRPLFWLGGRMRTLKGWWTSLLRVYFLFVGIISPPSPLLRFSRMNSSFGTMNLGTKKVKHNSLHNVVNTHSEFWSFDQKGTLKAK